MFSLLTFLGQSFRRSCGIRLGLHRTWSRLDTFWRKELDTLALGVLTDAERKQVDGELHAVKATLNRIVTQQKKLEAEYPELLREQLYTHTPTQVRFTITSAVPDVQRPEIERGIQAFERMVEHPMPHSLMVESTTKDRSYYKNGTIWMSATAHLDNRVDGATAHEMGHWLEDVNPGVRDAVRAFLDRRTAGETDIPLGAGYKPWEVTRPDQFRDPYVGKQYRTQAGKYYSTEVLPMGLEWFYNDPLGFAREDPDMFDFIYAIARKP